MTRLVSLDARGPRRLTVEDIDDEKGDIAICQCGLSATFPFCDGSHRRTEDEDPDRLYEYDDGGRREVERVVPIDEGDTI